MLCTFLIFLLHQAEFPVSGKQHMYLVMLSKNFRIFCEQSTHVMSPCTPFCVPTNPVSEENISATTLILNYIFTAIDRTKPCASDCNDLSKPSQTTTILHRFAVLI